MYFLSARTKLLLTLLPVSVFLLILLTLPLKNSPTAEIPHLHIHKHFQIAHSACEGTLYTQLCVSTLLALPDLTSKSLPELISGTINRTMYEVGVSYSNCSGIRNKFRKIKKIENVALTDCLELFSDTIDELTLALADLSTKALVSKHYHDLQTLLSAAMTNQYTCLDGFAYSRGNVRKTIKTSLYNISRHVSNSLVMLKKISGVNASKSAAFPDHGNMKRGFPSWLSSKDRKLLQAPPNATNFDLIVAKDGTGNFTTIGQAVAAAPNSSTTRCGISYSLIKDKSFLVIVQNNICIKEHELLVLKAWK